MPEREQGGLGLSSTDWPDTLLRKEQPAGRRGPWPSTAV